MIRELVSISIHNGFPGKYNLTQGERPTHCAHVPPRSISFNSEAEKNGIGTELNSWEYCARGTKFQRTDSRREWNGIRCLDQNNLS